MNTPAKSKVITDRDQRLFMYIFENKIALGKQIRRDVFENRSFSAVNKRLAKLRHAGWLDYKVVIEGEQMRLAYSASRKAFRKFIKPTGDDFKGTKLKSEVPYHDIILGEIRSALVHYSNVRWYQTENMLVRDNPEDYEENFLSRHLIIRLDGKLCINGVTKSGEDLICGLEYEATPKSPGRYRKKVMEYYVKDKSDAILYIFGTKVVERTVKRTEQELMKCGESQLHKTFYCDVQSVLRKMQTLNFVSQDDRIIRLERKTAEGAKVIQLR
ncbi:MAG: hypothetical protein KDD48_05375 [Bdellovibrionales bacterium]|nr:hypothetical protein [Bdellovibrionales bacterium]